MITIITDNNDLITGRTLAAIRIACGKTGISLQTNLLIFVNEVGASITTPEKIINREYFKYDVMEGVITADISLLKNLGKFPTSPYKKDNSIKYNDVSVVIKSLFTENYINTIRHFRESDKSVKISPSSGKVVRLNTDPYDETLNTNVSRKRKLSPRRYVDPDDIIEDTDRDDRIHEFKVGMQMLREEF